MTSGGGLTATYGAGNGSNRLLQNFLTESGVSPGDSSKRGGGLLDNAKDEPSIASGASPSMGTGYNNYQSATSQYYRDDLHKNNLNSDLTSPPYFNRNIGAYASGARQNQPGRQMIEVSQPRAALDVSPVGAQVSQVSSVASLSKSN